MNSNLYIIKPFQLSYSICVSEQSHVVLTNLKKWGSQGPVWDEGICSVSQVVSERATSLKPRCLWRQIWQWRWHSWTYVKCFYHTCGCTHTQEATRNPLEVISIITLIVVTTLWMYAYVQTLLTLYIKYVQLLVINYTSRKLFIQKDEIADFRSLRINTSISNLINYR